MPEVLKSIIITRENINSNYSDGYESAINALKNRAKEFYGITL